MVTLVAKLRTTASTLHYFEAEGRHARGCTPADCRVPLVRVPAFAPRCRACGLRLPTVVGGPLGGLLRGRREGS